MNDGFAAMLRTLNDAFPRVESMSAQAARAAIAARRQVGAHTSDAVSEDLVVGNGSDAIVVRVYRQPGEAIRPALVFLHGGGFVLCDLDSHDDFCRVMSRRTDSVVVSVGYRLAPEHPAPTAAEDAYRAFQWTVRHATDLSVDPRRIAVAGDSAGGNLAAVVALLCRERNAPMPVGQLLLYPVIDPACDTTSHRTRATGYVTTHAALQWYWRQYLADTMLPEPAFIVAPGRAASLAGLPAAVVLTADLDPLHDEGTDYARRLRRDGVLVLHRDFRGLFHGFLTLMDFPPAVAAREILWSDLRDLLRTPAQEVMV